MNVIMRCTIFWMFIAFASGSFHEENKDCGGTFDAHPIGKIRLTDHTLSTHSCEWKINMTQVQNTTTIHLFFEELFLHENDEVTVYKSNDMNTVLIKPLRAQNGSVTVVTDELELTIILNGTDTSFQRELSVMYQAQKCAFAPTPAVQLMHSPILVTNESEVECEYTFIKDIHKLNILPVFIFEEFNFSISSVDIKSASFEGNYQQNSPIDFFPQWKTTPMTITTKMLANSTEYYRLKIYHVDERCSGMEVIPDDFPHRKATPQYILNNGSIINECRWVFQHSNPNKILGLELESINFNNVLDIISINDGGSELSLPLLQVTSSNKNLKQMIRSTGNYVWISFKPITYASSLSFNVTAHGQGGYFKNNGSISMVATTGNDTVFMLEVENGKIVHLNFISSDIRPPGKLSIYDGFDTSNLLASLQGNIWYPIVGKSSQLMAIATGFTSSAFSAEFEGVLPGCLHMSTLTSENYILNENCNTTCQWIIPPQDTPNSVLLLDLQYISLKNEDKIEIMKLDSAKTLLGTISSTTSHTPQLAVEANIGVLVKITQRTCEKNSNRVVLIGHSSYMPACGQSLSPMSSESFLITSPRYPDTYPLLAKCEWNISLAKDNFLLMTFNALKLAPDHCIQVTADKKTYQFSGSELPNDMLLKGEITVDFDSKDCKKTVQGQALISDVGFELNNTVFDCGAILNEGSGSFNTNTMGNKTLCVWFISVPQISSGDDSVNIISYTITKKDDFKNYDLHIYDGGSVRINVSSVDMTTSGVWSRTNKLIIVYKRLNVLKPSSILDFKYSTISCNSSMQCENKICLHPDWRCNGVNDCGDFTDEKNCASVPIPPKIVTGYSSAQFGGTAFGMLLLGTLIGLFAFYVWQKKRDGQYSRFGTTSVIE